MIEAQIPLFKTGGVVSVHLSNYSVFGEYTIVVYITYNQGHSGVAYLCSGLQHIRQIHYGHDTTVTYTTFSNVTSNKILLPIDKTP